MSEPLDLDRLLADLSRPAPWLDALLASLDADLDRLLADLPPPPDLSALDPH